MDQDDPKPGTKLARRLAFESAEPTPAIEDGILNEIGRIRPAIALHPAVLTDDQPQIRTASGQRVPPRRGISLSRRREYLIATYRIIFDSAYGCHRRRALRHSVWIPSKHGCLTRGQYGAWIRVKTSCTVEIV
jgi:hypothetical protein